MERIARAAPMREVGASTVVYRPGDEHPVLFILKRGRVRVYRLAEDGRSLTMSIVERGEIFGEMPELGLRMAGSGAETLEPSLVCLMSRDDVERLVLGDGRVAARLATTLGERVSELERRLEDAVFRSVPSRVASTLALLAGSGDDDVRLTHEQLADLVGTTRETVTKVLGDLRGRGLVTSRRGRIRVQDRAALADLATSGGSTAVTGGHAVRRA
ncbi:MAG: helix-turn-helix domain-containing protein [Frankiales bacterium]|nr:helix-turn-helix domain-containing protein [Frankiales bacterium]